MLNNSSRFCLKNTSALNPLSQSQLPIQTYSFKLQNNKPVKLFVRIKNQNGSQRDEHLRVITFVEKISSVFIRNKREVFEDCKAMMEQVEEYDTHGPSLLEEMMKSEIPMRNGSFMYAAAAFSVIKSTTQLNKSRDSISHPNASYNNQRNSVSDKFTNGIQALQNMIECHKRRQGRQIIDILKQNSKNQTKQLLQKVIHKIAYGSSLSLQSSILRLKSICARKRANPQQQQPQQIPTKIKDEQIKQLSPIKQLFNTSNIYQPLPQQVITQSTQPQTNINLANKLSKRVQQKRIQCFITLLDNIDKLKTFQIVCNSFNQLKSIKNKVNNNE